MKAVKIKDFGDANQLYLDEMSIPEVAENEVLIKVKAAALNRADILQRRGFYPPPPGASNILGLEVSGEVVESGKDARAWMGRKVMSLLSGGGYAQYVSVDQGLVLEVPDNLTTVDAAGIMEAYLTAFQALHWLAEIRAGERLLIHAAASGVGTAAIQLAREVGCEIWVTASAPKHALCLDLGANHAIDYKKQDFPEEISRLSPKGMNVIMDFIGAPYFHKNLQCLSLDGRLVMQGFLGGPKEAFLDLTDILRKRLKIMGSTLRSRSLDYRVALIADFDKHYWQKFCDGKLKPVIDRVFDWHQVVEAHKYMEANLNQGKIILAIDP